MDKLHEAHARCRHNRSRLTSGTTCGCFHCLRCFDAAEVWEWVEWDDSALCPRCGIDAVLTSPEDDLSPDALLAMCVCWFGAEWADYAKRVRG